MMKVRKWIKRITATLMASLCALACAACGDTGEIPAGPNYDRTIFNNPNFISFAYGSVNNGTTEVKGLDWTTGRNMVTLEKFKEYKECGFDVIMPQSYAVSKAKWTEVLDLAQQADLKVLITDNRIYQGHSKDEDVINGTTYARDVDLDYAVKSWLSDYMNHPAFYGVLMGDEVADWELDGSYGRLYRAVRRVLDNNGHKDKIVYANIMDYANYSTYAVHDPEKRYWTELSREKYCEILSLNVADYEGMSDTDFYKVVEGKAWKSRELQMEICWYRYTAFCEKFFEKTGASFVAVDWYPLYNTAKDYMITSLQALAAVCAEYDAEMHCVAQANRYMSYNGTDTRGGYSEDDMRWMNDIMIAFGAKCVMYFCYYVHSDDGNGWFLETCSFETWYGEKTKMWYFMQDIIAQNKEFACVFNNFAFKTSRKYIVQDARTYQYEYLEYAKDQGEFTALKDVSLNQEGALITELYDERFGVYMYGVINMVDPIDKGARSYEIVTLTFDDVYEYAVIWKDGEKQEVALKNHTLKVENAAGEVTYVIPYSA